MTHDEMIAVIQAHKDGKTIEVKMKNHLDWRVTSDPWFNFRLHDYRIKPEPRSLWVVRYEKSGNIVSHHESYHEAMLRFSTIINATIHEYKEVLP